MTAPSPRGRFVPARGERAGPVAVLTDAAAALPASWAARFAASGAFASVALPVLIDGQPVPPEPAGPHAALLVALAEGRAVTTSRPSPARVRELYEGFRDAGYRAIVSVHLSSQLSGTLGSARWAAQDLGIPVRLVDTRSAGLGQGLAVRAAMTAALAGRECDDVAAAAAAAARDAQVLLRVCSLDTLRRGGRMAAARGAVPGTTPLLSVQDGAIVTVERPVSRPEAHARFLALAGQALAHARPSAPVLGIHHVGDPEGARKLGETLVSRYRPGARLQISELPPVLGAHVGLGAQVAVIEGPTDRPIGHGAGPAPEPR